MASLVAMFCKGESVGDARTGGAHAPLAKGSTFRTESITIGVSSNDGNLVASEEDFLILKAGGECWVTVGVDAEATEGEGIHLFANERFEVSIDDGDNVAVIEASTSITA